MEGNPMLKGLYVMNSKFPIVYSEEIRRQIEELVQIYAPPMTREKLQEQPELLQDLEVLFCGWGAPVLNETFLEAAPNLKAVFYGAGSIRSTVTEAFWEKGIPITSAYAANALPVADYTLSQILFLLKGGWHAALQVKKERSYRIKKDFDQVPGTYGSTVGLVSLGMIGRRVCELLKPFDLKVIAYDPFVSEEAARSLNVELCGLEELFRRADVVSLHTPWLEETVGMIKGEHFASMKPWASFLNTSRGAVVREEEMLDVLAERPDLFAVLDVTYPEPPAETSRIYSLPNVIVTPHIAGSINAECGRMGSYMLEELRRYLAGEPLKWQITREKAAIMA